MSIAALPVLVVVVVVVVAAMQLQRHPRSSFSSDFLLFIPYIVFAIIYIQNIHKKNHKSSINMKPKDGNLLLTHVGGFMLMDDL